MKSIAHRIVPFAAAATLTLSLAGSARADALPEDSCGATAHAGDTCNNAGAAFDEPGTCTSETCSSSHPDGDGGFTTSNYDCLLCETGDGGSSTKDGGSSSGDGGAITTRPDGGTNGSTSSSSSGCSASPGERDGATGFAMLALGILGLAVTRKKRA